MNNDITPIINACVEHINGFSKFKQKCGNERMFYCELAFYTHQLTIKHEYWDNYVQMALEVVYKSHSLRELILNFKQLSIPNEWRNKGIFL